MFNNLYFSAHGNCTCTHAYLTYLIIGEAASLQPPWRGNPNTASFSRCPCPAIRKHWHLSPPSDQVIQVHWCSPTCLLSRGNGEDAAPTTSQDLPLGHSALFKGLELSTVAGQHMPFGCSSLVDHLMRGVGLPMHTSLLSWKVRCSSRCNGCNTDAQVSIKVHVLGKAPKPTNDTYRSTRFQLLPWVIKYNH